MTGDTETELRRKALELAESIDAWLELPDGHGYLQHAADLVFEAIDRWGSGPGCRAPTVIWRTDVPWVEVFWHGYVDAAHAEALGAIRERLNSGRSRRHTVSHLSGFGTMVFRSQAAYAAWLERPASASMPMSEFNDRFPQAFTKAVEKVAPPGDRERIIAIVNRNIANGKYAEFSKVLGLGDFSVDLDQLSGGLVSHGLKMLQEAAATAESEEQRAFLQRTEVYFPAFCDEVLRLLRSDELR